jgi:CRP-like cAMP-binding protein
MVTARGDVEEEQSMSGQIAVSGSHCHFRPHQFLARDEQPEAIFQIDEGWACRYRLLSDGRRQITGLFLPGDICEPHWALGTRPTQPIVALTNVRATCLPCSTHGGLARESERACWKNLTEMIERQANWLVTLGRKTALERLAHLLLELFERMRASGLSYGQQCAMPLTQMEIADMTGLTPVHVNRTLQAMRSRGLVELQSKWLRIPDLAALRDVAGLSSRQTIA